MPYGSDFGDRLRVCRIVASPSQEELAAQDVGSLFAARALHGAAVGTATSALVQYGPAPTRLIWWLLLGADLAAADGVMAMPETAAGRPGVLASLRPRVAMPRQARRTFARAMPCLIAVWMISGF